MNSPAFYMKRLSAHSIYFFIAHLLSCVSIIFFIGYTDLEMLEYIYSSLLHIDMLMISYFIISRPFIYRYRVNLAKLCAAERQNMFISSILVIGTGLFIYKLDLTILILLLAQCFIVFLFANCLEFLCSKLSPYNIRKVKRFLQNNQQIMTDIIPGVYGENINFAFLTNKNEYYICHTLYFSTVLYKIDRSVYNELLKINMNQQKEHEVGGH